MKEKALRTKMILSILLISIIITGTLFFVPGEARGALADTSWPSYRCGAQNTGFSDRETGGHEGELRWTFQADRSIYSSPSIDENENIYFGSVDEKLYSVSHDGNLNWAFKANGRIGSSVAIDQNGVLYFGSDGGNFYALTTSGGLLWNYSVGDSIRSSPVIGSEGTVYFGSRDGHIYALSPEGELLWREKLGPSISSSPALDEHGNIYIGSNTDMFEEGPTFWALDPQGNILWNSSQTGAVVSSPAIDHENRIYAGSRDGNLYVMESDGNILWEFETNGSLLSSPGICPDGDIYITSMDGRIYSLDRDGRLRWYHETDGYMNGSPSLSSDGFVHFGSSDGNFYSITSEGELHSVYEIGAEVISSPAIGYDGTIYIGAVDGILYAFGEYDEKIPDSPANIRLEYESDYVNVSWNFDGEPDELTKFNIYRTVEDGDEQTFSVDPHKRYYHDSDVEKNTTYQYRVTSVNEFGESPPGETASIFIEPEESEKSPVMEKFGFGIILLFGVIMGMTIFTIYLSKKRASSSELEKIKETDRISLICPFCSERVNHSKSPSDGVRCPRCKNYILPGIR